MKENQYYSGIGKLSQLIREQKVSPVEIVDTCLHRIEDLNPKFNAFITVLTNPAKEQAKVAEAEIKAGKWRGPLHGIPVGIKDFYDTAGIKTTAAFVHFKDRVPKKDADGVARLRQAGAIVIGKTNMHQLGMGTTGLSSYFGPVHNPWNINYIAGGSSAGSAAAIASGLCYATLDTDAIGSCRLPAACCGVVGFKGTYNLISTKGILEGEAPPDDMILWLGHAGITTRSVEDTAIMLDVLATTDRPTPTTNFFESLTKEKKLNIGVTNNYRTERQVAEAFEKAIETIRSLGHHISTSAAMPFGDPFSSMGNIEADRRAVPGHVFKDIDVLLLPTTVAATPATKTAASNPQSLSPENTAFANYFGLPAISVPCGFDANNVPIGLQIVGKPWDDSTVLLLAYQFELATVQDKRHPVV